MLSERGGTGPISLTSVLVVIAVIVAGVWAWNSLHYDTQDFITEEVLPIAVQVLLVVTAIWLVVRRIRGRRQLQQRMDRLVKKFQAETSPEKRLDLAFLLVELNGYKSAGLEPVIPTMATMFKHTLTTALGDKQHRIRGMAASHLGAIEDRAAVPLLIKALEDDHAYVRSSAALALGRMRVAEAKEKLGVVMKDDWDQTVRSRAREAFERIG